MTTGDAGACWVDTDGLSGVDCGGRVKMYRSTPASRIKRRTITPAQASLEVSEDCSGCSGRGRRAIGDEDTKTTAARAATIAGMTFCKAAKTNRMRIMPLSLK